MQKNSAKIPRWPAPGGVMVDTIMYEWTHKHKPRGRGTWFFEIRAYDKWMDPVRVPGFKTYTEAKREFVKIARTLGATHIRVSP